jgi:hypothetical protein
MTIVSSFLIDTAIEMGKLDDPRWQWNKFSLAKTLVSSKSLISFIIGIWWMYSQAGMLDCSTRNYVGYR